MKPLITCQQCGKIFTQRWPNQKYCGQACNGIARSTPDVFRDCVNCGKNFKAKKSRKEESRFCCKRCMWDGSKKPTPQYEYTCHHCGKQFTNKLNRTDKKYCSEPCQHAAATKRIPKTCERCGKSFTTHLYRKDIARFCSHKCARLNLGETSLEKKVRCALQVLKVSFKQEHVFYNKRIDFYLPSLNVALEVDGDYWHSNPVQKQRDIKRDAFLASYGITTVRVTESELCGSRAEATQRLILEKLQSLKCD